MRRANPRRSLGLVLGLLPGLLLVGCAVAPAPSLRQPAASMFRDAMSLESARDRVAIGSSKQALREALGPAEVIAFDSGYEVWVYREAGPRGRARPAGGAQLVILVTPSGRVEKVRIRPADGGA